jgi:hypothetical protein
LSISSTAKPELGNEGSPRISEAPSQNEEKNQEASGQEDQPSPPGWLKRHATKPVIITAGAISLALIAAATFFSLDTSAATGILGNHASAPVHQCARQIGDLSTADPDLPATLTDFRGAPFSSSTMAVYGASIDGAQFVIGPNSGSCIYAGGADGSTYMRVVNDAGNEAIFETYVPGGIEIVSGETCSAFPDLRATVNDVRNNNAACPVAQAGGAHRITTGEEVKGLNAGLNQIAAGKGSQDLEASVPASKQYPTWVLDVANVGFGPKLDFKSIDCTVPQADKAVCVASFDYFLAELVKKFGYGMPNLSSAFDAIRSYVNS